MSAPRRYSYTPGAGPNGSDFSPLWPDDFDGAGVAAPDARRWWAANWTFEHAVNDYVPDNARVSGGALVLTFTPEGEGASLPPVPADELDP